MVPDSQEGVERRVLPVPSELTIQSVQSAKSAIRRSNSSPHTFQKPATSKLLPLREIMVSALLRRESVFNPRLRTGGLSEIVAVRQFGQFRTEDDPRSSRSAKKRVLPEYTVSTPVLSCQYLEAEVGIEQVEQLFKNPKNLA
jgi:hypothetical protein